MKYLITLPFTFVMLFFACMDTQKIPITTASIKKSPIFVGDTVSQLSFNIMVIYQDKKNNYWFGSWKDGLYKFNGTSIIHFTTKHGLSDNRVEEIKEDKYGNIFINTRAGLCKYDGKKIVPISVASSISESKWELRPDDLWFKSSKLGYVCRYDGNSAMNLKIPNNKIIEKQLSKYSNAIEPHDIYCIYKDMRGNIWFGTAITGALRYNGSAFDWISEPDVTELHNGPANGVRSIIEDKDGKFWFNCDYRYSIFDGPRLYEDKFYLREKSIGNLDGKKDSHLNEYLSIAKDHENSLWIATYRDGVWKYDGNTITHYTVQENGKDVLLFYIYKDNHGKIWLGTHEKGAFIFNGNEFKKFSPM
jgi:ligand-binding sensor domain-containing protein